MVGVSRHGLFFAARAFLEIVASPNSEPARDDLSLKPSPEDL